MEAAQRVRDLDNRQAGRGEVDAVRCSRDEDRGSSPLDRVANEGMTVRPLPREGDEQVAGNDLSRIDGGAQHNPRRARDDSAARGAC